jgi:predicted GNAT superfamily acetyltransferase
LIERANLHDLLDPEKFAASLDLDQAGFLIMWFKEAGSTSKKFHPLREALEKRVRESPITRGRGQLVARRFYKERNGQE